MTFNVNVAYVVLTLVAFGILIGLLITCNNKDKFCVCRGVGNKSCPNPESLKTLYEKGILTEYTDFAKNNTPKWQTQSWDQFLSSADK